MCKLLPWHILSISYHLTNCYCIMFFSCSSVLRMVTHYLGMHFHTHYLGTFRWDKWQAGYRPWKNLCNLFPKFYSPFPQIDIIGAMMMVWRVRVKIIRSALCNIVCNNCAQCDAHMNRPNSSLDWVLSHWAHFTVLRFIFVYVLLHACVGL